MRAMQLERIVDLASEREPLTRVVLDKPTPGPGQVLVAVSTCGVCHTEIDEIEGRTPPPRLPVIPGHEVVGRVAALGAGCRRFREGDRVGIGWIHASDGSRDENIREAFVATGRDVNGGYAEYMVVGETYAYPIPDGFTDVEAAPLLCAGGVGYRVHAAPSHRASRELLRRGPIAGEHGQGGLGQGGFGRAAWALLCSRGRGVVPEEGE